MTPSGRSGPDWIPRIGALCAGTGALELGVMDALGGDVVWHSEVDEHASAILEAHWPGVPNYGDIKLIDWSAVQPIDVLTAGYPCQPFSQAGLRKGSDDGRHLWPFVAVAIGALGPQWVVLENVAGHVSLGLDVVLGDLAKMGYDATWGLVRASDAGAPHGRARVFILARDPYSVAGTTTRPLERRPGALDEPGAVPGAVGPAGVHPASDAPSDAWRVQDGDGIPPGGPEPDWGVYGAAIDRWARILGRRPPEPVDGDGLTPRFSEWAMGFPLGWVTDVDIPRTAQHKALGNGVVRQQASLAIRTLLELEGSA